MAQHIGIIQISHPGPTDESQYDSYWTEGLGSQLRSMYGALLNMCRYLQSARRQGPRPAPLR